MYSHRLFFPYAAYDCHESSIYLRINVCTAPIVINRYVTHSLLPLFLPNRSIGDIRSRFSQNDVGYVSHLRVPGLGENYGLAPEISLNET
jgi:hypothetical protein